MVACGRALKPSVGFMSMGERSEIGGPAFEQRMQDPPTQDQTRLRAVVTNSAMSGSFALQVSTIGATFSCISARFSNSWI